MYKENLLARSVPQPEFRARYGPWAVVAGAAEGLGAAVATELAQRGLRLWLVDHHPDRLTETADRLAAEHGTEVYPQLLDLGAPGAAGAIADALRGREVGLLAYVAAARTIGPFTHVALSAHHHTFAVNCSTPVSLIHALAPAMCARGRGGILLFSSLAGFQGTAQLSTYAASKAFDLVLAESLAAELEPLGVDVTACCPGPTATPAYRRSSPKVRPSPVMTPEAVAARAVARLGQDRVVVPGVVNRIGRWLLTGLGRRRAVDLVSRTTRRMYPRPIQAD